MNNRLKPKRGSIAICGIGCLGLITSDSRKEIVYNDGNVGMAYCGIHLTDKVSKIGSLWSSRNPKVICHIDDFEESLNFSKFLVKARFYSSPDCFNESYVVIGDNSGKLSEFIANETKVRLIPIREN